MQEPCPTKSKLCAVPWREIYLNPEIQYSLCCKEDQTLTVKTDAQNTDLGTHWHGQYMQKIREEFLAGKRISACDLCWQEEKENKISMRMRKNLRYLGTMEPSADDLIDTQIKGALISVGNQCQLRCVSCNPSYSRSILKDYAKLKWSQSIKTRFSVADSRGATVSASDITWQQLRSITPGLEWLTVTGGEPTLSRGLLEYLGWCCESGHADHITLIININGVNVKQHWVDAWLRFQRVKLTVSMDGTRDLEHYVRWPTDWEKKAQWVLDIKSLFPEITIHSVIHSLNVLGLPELVNWCRDNDLFHSVETLTYPDSLCVRNLPRGIKEAARNRLAAIEVIDTESDDIYDRDAYLINCLRSLRSRLDLDADPAQTHELLHIIHGYDNIRPKTLASILPEFSHI